MTMILVAPQFTPRLLPDKGKHRSLYCVGFSKVDLAYISDDKDSTGLSGRVNRRCECFDLYKELVPYKEAWSWQKSLVRRRHTLIDRDEDHSDMLIILQHPSVYTLGAGSMEKYLNFDIENAPHDIYRTERGGEVTYHGPGQEEAIVEPELVKDNSPAANISQNSEFTAFPTKDFNRRIALVSTSAAVVLFLSARLDFGISLKDLSASATPYEEALSNGLPTVVEFYADWCEVCRELAPNVYKVEQKYKDQVNFVMLNVDNTKWEQELDEFGVEGIPHFAFLDKNGNEEGNIVGRLPEKYLLENIAALVNGEPSIPHSRVVGQYSSAEARKVHQVVDPRSHG